MHQYSIKQEFEAELKRIAQQQGKPISGVEDILKRELGSNILKRLFKKASLEECQDLWRYGYITYRSSANNYRLQGMLGSLEHFAHVIKEQPIISLIAMAGVTLLGHAKPVIGAISGGAIMAISSATILFHEFKALHQQGPMNAHKAKHYQESGENLTAFLLTLIGAKGIKKGLDAGLEKYREPVKQASPLVREMKRIARALNYKDEGKHKMTPKEFIGFIIGLLDDSLVPFNWVAEKMQK